MSEAEEILLKLYDHAIKNCEKAIKATDGGPLTNKGEYIGKMQDIVIELNNSLDYGICDTTAKELSSLYDFILFASTQANIRAEVGPLKECLEVLNALYKGFKEAIKANNKRDIC